MGTVTVGWLLFVFFSTGEVRVHRMGDFISCATHAQVALASNVVERATCSGGVEIET